MSTVESILESLGEGSNEPVYLVSGNMVLAEPAARKLAEGLAGRGDAQIEVVRRPTKLGDLMGDLRTYSLFAGCRVMLVLESALLADHKAAAELMDQVAEALPVASADVEMDRSERAAAGRLLQVLRLFEIDPYGGSAQEVLARLPAWSLEGGGGKGKRKRAKAKVESLRTDLVALLDRARASGLHGTAESDLAELGEILENGLPPGHALVLAESAVSKDHPITVGLVKRDALIELSQVESGRGGAWKGLEALAGELGEETGVSIDREALAELGRRTLKQGEGGRSARADGESTARFAAEYRKLAALAGEGRISTEMVGTAVEDRGQEDVWQVLDAIGAGQAGQALRRMDRYFAAADDEHQARFSLFGLIGGFCRQLTAVQGAMRIAGVPAGERNYNRFKSALAPRLQGELEGGENPLKGLHPYRLHRVYLAASQMPEQLVSDLPWKVLETELRLKGESRDAHSALVLLVSELATANR